MKLTLVTLFLFVFTNVFSQGWNVGPGGNSQRNGLSPQYGPDSNELLWSGGMNAVISQQAVSDGVYLVMPRIANLNDVLHGTVIVAQNLLTGEELWNADLPVDFPATDWRNRVSAIRNGIVYATRAGNNNESYLYALDAGSGEILWKSEAVIDEGSTEGLVFTPAGDVLVGSMYYLTRISSLDGSTVWQTERLSYDDGAGAIVANGKVYTTVNLTNHVGVAAFDVETGDLLYTSTQLSGGLVQQLGIFAGPDGTVYLPRCQNNPTTDSLFALEDNGVTLRRKWAVPIGYTPFATLGIGPDGSVYAYNTALEIMRLDPETGTVLNISETISPEGANSPRMAIDAAGRLFVTNGGFDDGMIFSFDADLTLRWSEAIYRVNLGGPAIGIDGTMIACGVGTDVRAYKGGEPAGVTFTSVTEGAVVNDGGWNYGMAWFDYNNDNYPDLFVANNDENSGKNNFMYVNNGDGTFWKMTGMNITSDGGSSYAVTAVDINHNNHVDVFVANHNENNFLYTNNGDGTFYKVTDGIVVNDGGKSVGCAFADYNLDGNADLYVVNRDEKNFLYYGLGNGEFIKVEEGDIVNDVANSSGCAWGDYDNDNYPDLYVANSGTPGCLYHNNGDGTFTKVEEEPFLSDISYCSGASWGDADNDGDLDLFVPTGQLGMYQDFFYLNNGDGTFTKITDSPLVNELTWASGSAWGDYDKDGDLDLAVGAYDGHNLLYNNDGTGNFTKVENNAFVEDANYTEGIAWADIDMDGDLDIFAAKNNYFGGNNALFLNDGNNSNWIKIKVINWTLCLPELVNDARILVYATINGQPVMQMRELSYQTGGGQGGQNEFVQFFGLGDASVVDSIVVNWYSMNVSQTCTNIAINQYYEFIFDWTHINKMDIGNEPVISIYPVPASRQVSLRIVNNKNQPADISVFNLQGKFIKNLWHNDLSAGKTEIVWDLSDQTGARVKPGFYLCRYRIGDLTGSKKIVVR